MQEPISEPVKICCKPWVAMRPVYQERRQVWLFDTRSFILFVHAWDFTQAS